MTGRGGEPVTRYRMPAEWEPHDATWLSWPHAEETWPGVLERIPAVWAAMVRELRRGEAVRILTTGDAMAASIGEALDGDLWGVELFDCPTSDVWIRDYGPIFVFADGEAAGGVPTRPHVTNWGFNAWGDKYPELKSDEKVPGWIAEQLGLPVVEGGMILEGGSIDTDGAGTFLTTEGCLLHGNRNRHLDRDAIEGRLGRALGARRILWLGDGIAGDDTDGHVDDLTRFVAPGRVVTALERNPRDENYRALRENRERLDGQRDAEGRLLEVIELPMPRPVVHRLPGGKAQRCPASYANFYIGVEAVLVPTYRCEADQQALGILAELFPGRRVVGIDSLDLVLGLGSVHCVTQQQPSGAS